MSENWWTEYWWILPLLYVVLLLILIRRGMWEGAGRIIVLVVNCVLILLIPTMQRSEGYVMAVIIVVSLLVQEIGSRVAGANNHPGDGRT
jgi:uncharacterized membrane protein